MIILSITLNDGSRHSFNVKRLPRAWKSWLMRQLPYGTDFDRCTFTRGEQS